MSEAKDMGERDQNAAIPIDGNYIVGYATPSGLLGGGVATLRDGEIFGGDIGYVYCGTYRADKLRVTGTLLIKRYYFGAISVFGDLSELHMTFSGDMTKDGGRFEAIDESVPERTLKIDLLRHVKEE